MIEPAPAVVRQRLKRGWSDKRIAVKFGFGSVADVKNYRRRHKIDGRKPAPPKFDADLVRRLIDDNKTDLDIAEHYGATEKQIVGFRRRNKIVTGRVSSWSGPRAVEPQMDMTGTRWGRGSLGVDAIAELYGGRRYRNMAPAPAAVKRLLACGWTDRRIAEEYGFQNAGHVLDYRRRHKLPRGAT